MADNEIRLNVTAVESEPLNVCVNQVPMNPVNVENTYKGINYNLLKNKPSIDGVTLEGDKTTAEVIGFDKEYVDEAILTTNAKIDSVEQDLSDRIDAVSEREGYSKEEIDNKVIVIEADIDAQADAIQKTRSDFMESDSELQQQINAHANELTTQKNDIDELGDQVAGIESKIPEGTSDTNPLINKQQLLDEEMDIRSDFNESVSELQTQITAQASAIANKVDVTGDTMTGTLNVPELNVQTPEGTLNLSITAGVATIATNNGLDIVSQTKFDTAPTTDDNTTWADALDTSFVRKAQVAAAIAEAGGGASVPDNVYTQENLKGGKDIEIIPEPVEGGIDEYTLSCFHLDESAEDVVTGYVPANVTVDTTLHKFGTGSTMWTNTTSFPWSLNSYESFSFDFWIYRKSDRGAALGLGTVGGSPSCHVRLFAGGYPIQFSIHGLSKDTGVYIDNNAWSHIYVYYNSDDRSYHLFLNGKEIYSEVDTKDFSNLNNFASDGYTTSRFDEIRISKCIRWTEDFEPPTQPYRKAEPTGNYVINFTGKAGGSGKNIGEVYYSQSSLASDNAGALPLFTGETIASANTIYPDFYAWVESHTELQATAEEYETALTTYGECPKYVVSDGSLRLPKLSLLNRRLVEKKEATETDPTWYNLYSDGYLEQGGKIGRTTTSQTITIELVKPFANTSYIVLASTKPDDSDSVSSRIYTVSKNLTTTSFNVTNNGWSGEYNGITGFWEAKGYVGTNSLENNFPWVFAYNASVPASTAQAAEFQEGLSGKVDLVAGVTNDKVDYVVDSYSDEEGNWYRIYKSGWIEQGGHQIPVVGEQFAEQTVMLLKPMKSTTYHKNLIASFSAKGDNTIVVRLEELTLYTDRIIVRKHWLSENGGFYWEVKGQGA